MLSVSEMEPFRSSHSDLCELDLIGREEGSEVGKLGAAERQGSVAKLGSWEGGRTGTSAWCERACPCRSSCRRLWRRGTRRRLGQTLFRTSTTVARGGSLTLDVGNVPAKIVSKSSHRRIGRPHILKISRGGLDTISMPSRLQSAPHQHLPRRPRPGKTHGIHQRTSTLLISFLPQPQAHKTHMPSKLPIRNALDPQLTLKRHDVLDRLLLLNTKLSAGACPRIKLLAQGEERKRACRGSAVSRACVRHG